MARRAEPFVCGIDAAIDVVGGKWKVLILWELVDGAPHRFAELRRGLPGVTEKVLAQHLRELERDGLVRRDVHPEVPPSPSSGSAPWVVPWPPRSPRPVTRPRSGTAPRVSATLAGAGDVVADRTVVDLTNTTPAQARARSGWIADHGGTFLDGGILAVPSMIGSNRATVLCSGDATAFEAARPALSALGDVQHIGDEPGVASLYDVALLSAMYGLFGGALHAFGLVRAAGSSAAELAPRLRAWLEAMLGSLDRTAATIDTGEVPGPAGSPLAMQARAFGNLRTTARDEGLRDDILTPIGRLLDEAVLAGHGDRDIDALVDLLPLPAARRA